MSTDSRWLSDGFARLYCDQSLFDSFSSFHPISFRHVLPFQAEDRVVDDTALILAEAAHLVEQNDRTRRDIVDAYTRCRLLSEAEAESLRPVLDYFDVDFLS